MKGSIIIVSFFIAGVLIGRFVHVPSLLTAEAPTLYALYALMFFVGISIGSDKKALEALKHQNFKIILVPLATIIGTLAGSALISLALSGKSLTDWIRILFSLNHFHHSVQRSRTRYNRPRFQHSTRIDRPTGSSFARALFRKTCPDIRGRSNDCRYHTPYYHEVLWEGVCNYIHCSRNAGRFKCTVFSYFLLYDIALTLKITPLFYQIILLIHPSLININSLFHPTGHRSTL